MLGIARIWTELVDSVPDREVVFCSGVLVLTLLAPTFAAIVLRNLAFWIVVCTVIVRLALLDAIRSATYP